MSRKVVVGTGWWCAGLERKWLIGHELTKSPAFFQLWYDQVRKYLAPHRIFVTDSASPTKPRYRGKPGIEWCELDRNYGHPMDIVLGNVKTQHSGFTRSLFLGCAYALSCDADYYVYVEQDCLVRGHGFLDAALEGTSEPIVVGQRNQGGRAIGGGGGVPPNYQQSVIIVRKDGFPRFLYGLVHGPETEAELNPEQKMAKYLPPFDTLAIGYGRSRPIDFTDSHFYAQHMQLDELQEYMRLEGLDFDDYFGRRAGRRLLVDQVKQGLSRAGRALRRGVTRIAEP